MLEGIKIIKEKISKDELIKFLNKPFADMIKIVVDVDQEIIALGGEMHADAEEILLREGSKQKNLWGANIFPDRKEDKKIKYDSLINIRPSQSNTSLEVQDENLKYKIKGIISKLINFN